MKKFFLLLLILVLVTSCNTGKLIPQGVSDSTAEFEYSDNIPTDSGNLPADSENKQVAAADQAEVPQVPVKEKNSAKEQIPSDYSTKTKVTEQQTVKPEKSAVVQEKAAIEDETITVPSKKEKNELVMADTPTAPVKTVSQKKEASAAEVKEVPIVPAKTTAVQTSVKAETKKTVEVSESVQKKNVSESVPESTKTVVKKTVPESLPVNLPEEVTKTDDEHKVVEPQPAVDNSPSRSVTISLKQFLDVVYPGAGWVYLGEIDESKNILSFSNRVLDGSDTKFTLQAKTSGVAVLHFYKQDVLTGTYIDDFLEVIVAPDSYNGKEHRTAPSYASIVPPNQQKYVARKTATIDYNEDSEKNITNSVVEETIALENAPSVVVEQQKAVAEAVSVKEKSSVNKTIQIDESAPVQYHATVEAAVPVDNAPVSAVKKVESIPSDITSMNAEQLLTAAKKAKSQGKLNDSLAYLNVFFDKATSKLDEGWYLRGQLYESAKADFRNVRTSLEAYQMLVDKYPSSTLWKSANNRIIYINRFYFKIR